MKQLNKDKIKESLTIEDVQNYIDELGGESIRSNDNTLVSKTICHGGESHKLYYYDNTHLFNCYTDCGDSFDIFELTQRYYKQKNIKLTLYQAIKYVASFFNLTENFLKEFDKEKELEDWYYINKKIQSKENQNYSQQISLQFYEEKILNNLPKPRIGVWEKEGISKKIIENNKICYNPINQSIVIPHYDINGKLVGIRERTLILDNEIYGKYKPLTINGTMYNHPLSFNLYNLNNSKKAISIFKKAFVFESEKSALKYASFFGEENDISVAVCGSNLITYQVQLLTSLGVEEIIIAFDRQYQKIGDDEYYRWREKLKKIATKFRKDCMITFLFDTEDILLYKDSPIDEGKEKFLYLYKHRLDADGKEI